MSERRAQGTAEFPMHLKDDGPKEIKRGRSTACRLSATVEVPNCPPELLQLAVDIVLEVQRAATMFGPIVSPHEALGIIQEEFEEFKLEVYAYNLHKGRDTRAKMRTELIQLAAMALKAIYCLEMPKEH